MVCFVKAWNNRTLVSWRWAWRDGDGEFRAINDYALGPFIIYFKENEWDISHVCFQQDGATAQTARVSISVIRETFAGHLVSKNGDIPWPPRLTDLRPCEFFDGGIWSPKCTLRTTHYSRIKRGHKTWNCSDSGHNFEKCCEKLQRSSARLRNVEGRHLLEIIFHNYCLYYQ